MQPVRVFLLPLRPPPLLLVRLVALLVLPLRTTADADADAADDTSAAAAAGTVAASSDGSGCWALCCILGE
jgi:hypothetical protein